MPLTLIDGGRTINPEDPSAAPLAPTVHKAGCVILLARSLVVLVRPHSGSTSEWVLPKGHLEDGETPPECAAREATEETGAILHPITIADLIEVVQRDIEASPSWPAEVESVSWFAARAASLETELITDRGGPDKLARQVGIFPAIAALAKLTYPDQRKVLAKAIMGGGEE